MTKERDRKLLRLSASRVKTFEQCPRKYYYTYLEKLPRKDWDHFSIGHLAHGTLEKFHENFRTDEQRPEKIKALMSQCFKAHVVEMQKNKEKITPEIVQESKVLVAGYLKRIEEKGIGSEICEVEQAFNLNLNKDYNILGYIDRVDKDSDGIFHIKDYKTNKNTKYMEPFQLKVYGIPLLECHPEIERFRGSYIMLRFEGMYLSYDFNREDVEKTKKDLIKRGDQITAEERWITKPSRLCDWCDFKGPCQNSW